jgi:hypothetical protein
MKQYLILKRIQVGSLLIKRLRKYIYLFGVGFAVWIGHLWDLLIEHTKKADEAIENAAKFYSQISESWLAGLWMYFKDIETPAPPPTIPKVYPFVEALNILGYIMLILCVLWVMIWIYADEFCKSRETNTASSFGNRLFVATMVNVGVYVSLRRLII